MDERPDDSPECVDGNTRLDEPCVKDRVVRRLDAGLADDLALLRVRPVRVGPELLLRDLAEEAEERSAERAERIVPGFLHRNLEAGEQRASLLEVVRPRRARARHADGGDGGTGED